MSSIEIAEIKVDEVNLLQRIAIRTFRDTYGIWNTPENMEQHVSEFFSEERLTAEITSEQCFFYFARMGAEVVGYLKLNAPLAQTEKNHPNSLEIERIYVLGEHQGKSIGKALIEKAIETTRNQKANYLWLGVWEKNPKAIAFYERCGFVTSGTHTFMLGTDPQRDYIMKREV